MLTETRKAGAALRYIKKRPRGIGRSRQSAPTADLVQASAGAGRVGGEHNYSN